MLNMHNIYNFNLKLINICCDYMISSSAAIKLLYFTLLILLLNVNTLQNEHITPSNQFNQQNHAQQSILQTNFTQKQGTQSLFNSQKQINSTLSGQLQDKTNMLFSQIEIIKYVAISLKYVQKIYSWYYYIKNTYPINAIFSIIVVVLIISKIISFFQGFVNRIFGWEITYKGDNMAPSDIKEITDQVKMMQKEIRQINKYIKKCKDEQQKEFQNEEVEDLKEVEQKIQGFGNRSEIIQDLTQKKKFTNEMETQIREGCSQVIKILKKHNSKDYQ